MAGHRAGDKLPEPWQSLCDNVSSWQIEKHGCRMSEKKIHDFLALSKSLHLIFHKLYYDKPNSHSCLGIFIQNELTKSASIKSIQFLLGNLHTEGCLPVNWIAGHIHPQCNGTACFHHDLEHVSPTTNGNMTCERTPCSPPTGTRNSHRTPVGSHALPATCGQQFVALVLNGTWTHTSYDNNTCTH